MPAKSSAQKRLMQGACYDKDFRKKVDVPKKVACEYVKSNGSTKSKKKNYD